METRTSTTIAPPERLVRPKASTAEILGGIKPRQKINPQWQTHFNQLLKARDAMLKHKGELTEVAKEEVPRFSLHIGDAGTDQYDQDFNLSMISADQNALYEIEDALSRIRSGTYGTCELTGNPIEPERLEAIPWARFSAEAQRQLEEEGKGGRIRFAQRHSLLEAEANNDADEGDEATE